MRIAFVTSYDPNDVRCWSGTPYFMKHALEKAGAEVVAIGPLAKSSRLSYQLRHAYHKRVMGKKYFKHAEPSYLKCIAKQVERKVEASGADLVLSVGTADIAYAELSIPVAVWGDSVSSVMWDYYDTFTNVSTISMKHTERQERQAFEKSSRIMLTSKWAADAAKAHNTDLKEKFCVVPLGANLDTEPTAKCVSEHISKRNGYRLLFVGKDWVRKGGPTVLKTVQLLRDRGHAVNLTIIGCSPSVPDVEWIEVEGVLSKDNPISRERLIQAYLNSSYLFVPSQAECYGLIFAEASSYGLPSITRDTGGIGEVVHEGKNGYLLSAEALAEDYADVIEKSLCDPLTYSQLAHRARAFYEERFRWGVVAQQALNQLESLLSS